jgi:hypothetical protein
MVVGSPKGAAVMSRVELFEAIRRGDRREDLSIRLLAHRHHVHRRAVRAALASATAPPRKPARTSDEHRLIPVRDDDCRIGDSVRSAVLRRSKL